MSNIFIISDIHDWHSKKIKFELTKLNYSVQLVKFDELTVKITNSKNIIYYKQKPFSVFAIWVRFIARGTLEELTFKLSILHIFEESNIYVHNSAEIIEKTVDKSRTSMILKINKINTPHTWIFNKKDKNKFINKLFDKNILIVKPLFGSQGSGIKILKNKKEYFGLKANDEIFYIQKFLGKIKCNNFSDLRILISNHKIISIIKRSSQNFLTNVCLGATVKKIKIDKDIKQICEKISKIFKLGYAGIDLKIHNKKIYVLEINSIPSWKGVQSVEKKNITKILVEDFISISKKKNEF